MAVHLNARLKTRFIPFLFTAAILASALAMLAHAEESVTQVPRAELQAILKDSVDLERLDRRPGFSETVVAPSPGERPVLAAQKDEGLLPEGSSPSTSLDRSPPPETLPNQR